MNNQIKLMPLSVDFDAKAVMSDFLQHVDIIRDEDKQRLIDSADSYTLTIYPKDNINDPLLDYNSRSDALMVDEKHVSTNLLLRKQAKELINEVKDQLQEMSDAIDKMQSEENALTDVHFIDACQKIVNRCINLHNDSCFMDETIRRMIQNIHK